MKKLLLPLLFSMSLTLACGGNTDTDDTSTATVDTSTATVDTSTATVDTSTATVDTSTSTAPYPECSDHSECAEEQFCGVECWTGGCGEEEDVSPNTRGQYCQPCVECESGEDSITGDCVVCYQ